MNNIKNYINAMNNLKYDDNLKEKVLSNVNLKLNKRYIDIPKKMLISFAFTEFVFCIFSSASTCCFIA